MTRIVRRRGGARLVTLLSALAASPVPAAPPGETVAGLAIRVHDEEGRPLPGARVSAFANPEGAPLSLLARATCGDDGIATLSPAPESPHLLSFSASGHLPRIVELVEGESPPRALELSRGRAVRLSVSDAGDGRPVRSFDVLPFPPDAGPGDPARIELILDGLNAQTFATEGGSAVVTGLPHSGSYALLVRAPGYPPAVTVVTQDARAVNVSLDDAGCVRRRVVDAETGTPVEGARVATSPGQLSGPLARLAPVPVSNGAGLVTICPSGASGWKVILAHERFAPRVIDLAYGGDAEPDQDGALTLSRGGRLEGTVSDANGVPVPRAMVTARFLGMRRRVASSPDGRFVIDRLPDDEVIVEAGAPGASRELLGRRTIRPREGRTTRLDFTPNPPMRVIVTHDDAPLADVGIVLMDGPRGSASEPVARSRTDARGEALVPRPAGLSDAPIVVLRADDWLFFTPLPSPVTGADETERRLEVSGRRVRGRVVDAADGGAVAGAIVHCARGGGALRVARGGADHELYVSAAHSRLRIDGEGAVAASGRRGLFELLLPSWCERPRLVGPKASGDGPAFADRVVEANAFPDDGVLEIALERGGALVATVAGPGGKALSRPATIALRRAGERHDRATSTVVDGRARLDVDEPGPWLVVARTAGLAPAVAGPLAVRAGVTTEVELALDAGGLVVATGLSGGVRGVGRAWTLEDSRGIDWSVIARSEPGEDGSLEIGPLPADRYTLVVDGTQIEVRIRFAGDVRVVTPER